MDINKLLILLCVLVIFSYLFDLIARSTRIPSVLMLLLLGIAIRYGSVQAGFQLFEFGALLPLLGTVGLILIVFEGALELKYEKGKSKLIWNALAAALFILLVTSMTIAGIFHWVSGQSFYLCYLNAIPFSVISSAIAIPSAASLSGSKKEFIIYESSFSDIIGIMMFNVILVNNSVNGYTIVNLGAETLSMMLIALVFCFSLLFLMGRMRHNVKFFLIISTLVLIYALGKYYHLASLLIVLLFGLFLENSELILARLDSFRLLKGIEKMMIYPTLRKDLGQLHQLSSESAFLLRTFFFLVFGYSMDLSTFNFEIVKVGLMSIVAIYLLRWIYLKLIVRQHVWPELLVSPRGLISVLLFLSIPVEKQVFPNADGLLLFIILTTSLLMTFALVTTGKQPTLDNTEPTG